MLGSSLEEEQDKDKTGRRVVSKDEMRIVEWKMLPEI